MLSDLQRRAMWAPAWSLCESPRAKTLPCRPLNQPWHMAYHAPTMKPLLDRISINPRICHGQPCVKGTRIMVWLIVQYLANGNSVEEVLAAYPSLTREDVRACLAYAAEMARERVLPVEVTT